MGALQELLNRARAKIKVNDLGDLVPNDPGLPDYVSVFERIVRGGETVLDEQHDGQRLFESFDFRETVNLTRWSRLSDPRRRWFRVLTCAAHLVARTLGEEAIPLHYSLLTLLVDSFSLDVATDRNSLITLLPEIFEQSRQSVLSGDGDFFARNSDETFCLLAELLVTDSGNRQHAEALCVALEELDQQASTYYLPGTFEKNPQFAPREEYVWGATVFDQLHPDGLKARQRVLSERIHLSRSNPGEIA